MPDLISQEEDDEGNMKTIEHTKNDCEKIRKAFKHYGVTDMGEVDSKGIPLYKMEDKPTFKQYIKVEKDLRKRLVKLPDEKFLIVGCFAGHGM